MSSSLSLVQIKHLGLPSFRLQVFCHCKVSSAEASLSLAAPHRNSLPLQLSLRAAETPLNGWLLTCLYMVTFCRFPSAHVQSLGRLLRFCWRLMMLSGELGTSFQTAPSPCLKGARCAATCRSLPAGFYWYLSKPETLPYIAHPVVQTAAWCTALAAAAVYRWSDMVSDAEVVCVAAWPALQSTAICAASCSLQQGALQCNMLAQQVLCINASA